MKRLTHFLVTTLIGGFVVVLPIFILVWVIKLIVTLVDAALRPIANLINLEIPELLIDIIALASVILFCFIVGLVVRTRLGKSFFTYLEKQWFEKLPVYSSIRDIVQQFSGRKKTPFTQVVIIEALGVKMTGFVTDEKGDRFTVFVPTAPNPTNGFVFHVSRNQIQFVDVRTEPALRTVVGMGVGSQDLMDAGEPGSQT